MRASDCFLFVCCCFFGVVDLCLTVPEPDEQIKVLKTPRPHLLVIWSANLLGSVTDFCLKQYFVFDLKSGQKLSAMHLFTVVSDSL